MKRKLTLRDAVNIILKMFKEIKIEVGKINDFGPPVRQHDPQPRKTKGVKVYMPTWSEAATEYFNEKGQKGG